MGRAPTAGQCFPLNAHACSRGRKATGDGSGPEDCATAAPPFRVTLVPTHDLGTLQPRSPGPSGTPCRLISPRRQPRRTRRTIALLPTAHTTRGSCLRSTDPGSNRAGHCARRQRLSSEPNEVPGLTGEGQTDKGALSHEQG